MKLQGITDDLANLIVEALESARPDVHAARLKEVLEVDAFEDLRECEVPVLCLYAERDLFLADHCHELIRKANPKVKMVGFDTPHFLLQVKPAEALREIQAFTRALSAHVLETSS